MADNDYFSIEMTKLDESLLRLFSKREYKQLDLTLLSVCYKIIDWLAARNITRLHQVLDALIIVLDKKLVLKQRRDGIYYGKLCCLKNLVHEACMYLEADDRGEDLASDSLSTKIVSLVVSSSPAAEVYIVKEICSATGASEESVLVKIDVLVQNRFLKRIFKGPRRLLALGPVSSSSRSLTRNRISLYDFCLILDSVESQLRSGFAFDETFYNSIQYRIGLDRSIVTAMVDRLAILLREWQHVNFGKLLTAPSFDEWEDIVLQMQSAVDDNTFGVGLSRDSLKGIAKKEGLPVFENTITEANIFAACRKAYGDECKIVFQEGEIVSWGPSTNFSQ